MPAKNEIVMHLRDRQVVHSGGLFQYDYGQRLIFTGVDLPVSYEVHFSNKEKGKSKTMIGDSSGVDIPDEMLLSGDSIYVWVFLHEADTDGETEYRGVIDVVQRAKPTDVKPTPVQQDVITQTIAALNEAVNMAEEAKNEAEEAAEEAKRAAEELIDDTAGSGDTNKTWSADKLTGELEDKADKTELQVVPLFMYDSVTGIYTCNMTYESVYAAVSDGRCTACAMGEYGQGMQIPLLNTNPGSLMFSTVAPSSNLPNYTQVVIWFSSNEGVVVDFYATDFCNMIAPSYARRIFPVSIGEYCVYNNYLYKANTSIETYETFNSAKWDAVTLGEDMATKADKTDTVLETTLSRGRTENSTVGQYSFAFGHNVTASGPASHAEGAGTVASGSTTHAEGGNTTASGNSSHAEGLSTVASGAYSHSEGQQTQASGYAAHTEGVGTEASGSYAHAEGMGTVANATGMHAEGVNNAAAILFSAWVSRQNYSVGDKVIYNDAGYVCVNSNADAAWNPANWQALAYNSDTAFVIGNGTDGNHASNAAKIDWDGNARLGGDVYVGCGNDSTGGTKLPDEARVNALIQAAIGQIGSFNIEIVEQLPQTGYPDTIYLVPKTPETRDAYNEYLYINNAWELIGSTSIDISMKADKADTILDTTLSRGRLAGTTVGNASIAFGDRVTASGAYSQAFGYNAATADDYAHAEGNSTYAGGWASHAEGYNTKANQDYSHAEGHTTTANESYSHAEGYYTSTSGQASHAEGFTTTASGNYSHAEGNSTTASGNWSHAEGNNTTASWPGAHAEGTGTQATDDNAHAEGSNTQATNNNAHAEGSFTIASGDSAHAEGNYTRAIGYNSHAEGGRNSSTSSRAVNGVTYDIGAVGHYSHTEGNSTLAYGQSSHAEGGGTNAIGDYSHAECGETTASGSHSHAEGGGTLASGYAAHAEGGGAQATGNYSHAEGGGSRATEMYAHAEGSGTLASGGNAHSEGGSTTASGANAHAEGGGTAASGAQSHAEGAATTASGSSAHAEGSSTSATAYSSHAEGSSSRATGANSHAEGSASLASGVNSHAEGASSVASGANSHAEGTGHATAAMAHAEGAYTYAVGAYSHVGGKNNIPDSYDNWNEWEPNTAYVVGDKVKVTTSSGGDITVEGYECTADHTSDETFDSSMWDSKYGEMNYAEIIGNGSDTEHPSNARTLDWDGNEAIAGNLTIFKGTANETTVTDIVSDSLAGKADKSGTILDTTLSRGRKANTTTGAGSFAFGENVEASGDYSHAEGVSTTAKGTASTAIGRSNVAPALFPEFVYGTAYTEGDRVSYLGKGYECLANNTDTYPTDTEYWGEIASNGDTLFVIGNGVGNSSSNAMRIDIDGNEEIAGGLKLNTTISRGRKAGTSVGTGSIAFGNNVEASGEYSTATGINTKSTGRSCVTSGASNEASGNYSYAEGSGSTADGYTTFAQGWEVVADGNAMHVIGKANAPARTWPTWTANTSYEVGDCVLRVEYGISRPYRCKTANSDSSFISSKWESINTIGTYKYPAWKANTHYLVGDKVTYAHPQMGGIEWGLTCIEENTDSEMVLSKWSTSDLNSDAAFVIGNGDGGQHSNAMTVDWQGNEYLAGDLYVGCGSDSTGGTKVAKITDIPAVATTLETQAIINEYGVVGA